MISLSAITSLLSLSAALVATWVMQATTHQAGLGTSSARLALAQRIELAALAIFLVLDAVTPFITPDPWLANLPLAIAIMAIATVSAPWSRADGYHRGCRRSLFSSLKSDRALRAGTQSKFKHFPFARMLKWFGDDGANSKP